MLQEAAASDDDRNDAPHDHDSDDSHDAVDSDQGGDSGDEIDTSERLFVKNPDLDELRSAIQDLTVKIGWGGASFRVQSSRGGWRGYASFGYLSETVLGELSPSRTKAMDSVLRHTGRWVVQHKTKYKYKH